MPRYQRNSILKQLTAKGFSDPTDREDIDLAIPSFTENIATDLDYLSRSGDYLNSNLSFLGMPFQAKAYFACYDEEKENEITNFLAYQVMLKKEAVVNEANHGPLFNKEEALESLSFYRLEDIPRLDISNCPSTIGDVSYRVN